MSRVIYLRVPFEERDDAKGLGATFDGSTKRWFVPSSHYNVIWDFNRWWPAKRLYLDEDKDKAEKVGAEWDPIVKAWFVKRAVNGVIYLDVHGRPGIIPPAARSSERAPPSSSRKKGNAQDAATRKINDAMTVVQLQEECRARRVSGYSGKTKVDLLELLGRGTKWHAMSMKDEKEKVKGAKAGGRPTPAKKPHTAKTKMATPNKATRKSKAKAAPSFSFTINFEH
jgi:hypothetical protein